MTKELIERLEKAAGPDREIDQAIAVIHRREKTGRPVIAVANCGEYTASADQALRLMPPNWRLELQQSGDGTWWNAAAYHIAPDDDQGVGTENGRPNPAIAICIAALRARAMETRNA